MARLAIYIIDKITKILFYIGWPKIRLVTLHIPRRSSIMARGPKRRVMVYVDYSAMRDAIRKNPWLTGQAGPRAKLDFEKMGRMLAGRDGEFIRLNLYTGIPVEVEERDDGHYMHNLAVYEHEAYRSGLIWRIYEDFVRHVGTQHYTELHSGRMVLHRTQVKYGPAFEWVKQLLAAISAGKEDNQLFAAAVRVNSRAKKGREDLAEMVERLKYNGLIPHDMMSGYADVLSQLRDESLDFTEKGVDTKLSVQMMEHCMHDVFDDAVLFAADEDYIPLVKAVKRTGRRVIHAFWDIGNHGWPLQQEADSSVLWGQREFRAIVATTP